MTVDDLIREYRYARHAAAAIGVSPTTLYLWRREGIPMDRQKSIAKIIAARKAAAK